jgi:hypothetical protein
MTAITDDAFTLGEQYGDAVAAGRQTEIVGSVAFASRSQQIGALLWRRLNGADQTVDAQLERRLRQAFHQIAMRQHWSPRDSAASGQLCGMVLHWYLSGICRTCGGLKFLKAPGAPHLSSTVCNACHGRGRIQALEGVVPRQFVSRAQQIAGYLDTAMGDIAKQVRQARR